jgi:HSP20 family protein
MEKDMTEQKFDPVKEFVTLRDSISRAVGESIRTVSGMTFPAVDVYETEDAVILYTEPLLGADPARFEVSMENDLLTISGETRPHVNVDDSAFLHRELRFGAFSRTIQLTRKVSAAQAAAAFKHNILTVTLPKIHDEDNPIIGVEPAE